MDLKDVKVITPTEDITAYMVLQVKDGQFHDVFNKMIYDVNTEVFHYPLNDYDYKNDDNCENVYPEMFYSYVNCEDASFVKNQLNKFAWNDIHYVVVKCIIPKYAKLVIHGVFDSGDFIYNSSEISLKTIIP